MLDSIKVFALGGLDELGKNMIVVEVNDDIFILDCGLKFPNKTTPGIDFLIPNLDYIKNNAHRVKAYFISHPHDEQIGALPFFYEYAPAPVYVTNYGKTVITRRTIFANKRLNYNFIVVKPTSRHLVAGHEVQLFQTCHNAYDSFGVAILTNRGYVVYSSEFIVDYDTKYKSFLFDLPALSKIAEKETLLFVNSLLKSSYPNVVKEAALFNLATLRSQTVFRIPSGHLMGWEGVMDRYGSCQGSCTHVWNYEMATPFLFGDLSKTMRDVEFNYATKENGLMNFRADLPLSEAAKGNAAAADGQMGCIMKIYRDWQLSGDYDFLAQNWEQIKLKEKDGNKSVLSGEDIITLWIGCSSLLSRGFLLVDL